MLVRTILLNSYLVFAVIHTGFKYLLTIILDIQEQEK